MPAIIIKRRSVQRSTELSTIGSASTEETVVVVVKDGQIEVYTDQEAETYLNKD